MSDSAATGENEGPGDGKKESLGIALSEKLQNAVKSKGDENGQEHVQNQNPEKPVDKPADAGVSGSGFDASKMYRCLVKDPDTGLVCGRLIRNDREAIREHERRVHGIKVNKSHKPVLKKPVEVAVLPIESLEKLQKVEVPARLPRPEEVKPKEVERQDIAEQDIAGNELEVEAGIEVVVPDVVETKKDYNGLYELLGIAFLGLLVGGVFLASRLIMQKPASSGQAITAKDEPLPPQLKPQSENRDQGQAYFYPPGVPMMLRR
jgi:hypothetical protein